MIASFRDLQSAKAAYALGEVKYRCLICRKVHSSKEKHLDCEGFLESSLFRDILITSALSMSEKNVIANMFEWGISDDNVAILAKACKCEPYWLMLRNKMPIVHEILNNRLTTADKEKLQIKR